MDKATQQRYQLIYGNTARKLDTAVAQPAKPAYEPKRRRRPEATPKVRKKQQRALEFDFAFVRMLVAALIVVVGVSFFYLSEQTKLTNQRNVMAQKKEELNTLQVENEDLNLEIEQSINLTSVEAAAKKYGMKKPSSKQILYYDSADADYVRQYGDIPDAN